MLDRALKKLPGSVNIGIKVSGVEESISAIERLNSALAKIERNITVTINVVTNGQIPSFHAMGGITAHATGGIIPHASGSIIARPTITQYQGSTHLFGEAGREAILPLDSYTGWMDEIANRVNNMMMRESGGMDIAQILASFYQNYFEPVMTEISADTKRQADKKEITTVRIGNKDIRDAYDTQKRADGYSFVR